MNINRDMVMKTLLGVFLLLIVYVGIRVASIFYVYEVIIEGILGFFFIYLFLRVFRSSETGLSKKEDLKIPKIGGIVKLASFVFTYSIVCFWSMVKIVGLIRYVVNSFPSTLTFKPPSTFSIVNSAAGTDEENKAKDNTAVR